MILRLTLRLLALLALAVTLTLAVRACRSAKVRATARAVLRTVFGGRFATPGAFRRAACNPVTVACAVAFLLAIAVMWLMTANASRREARVRLRSAAADMHMTVNECADNLMFYQGQAIVNHFRDPQAMTVDTVQDLMARYGLDELNVVDRNGIVLSGALADVGYDMGSKPKTAEFNCLLMGARTFSQDFRPPVEDPNGEKRKYAGIAFPWPKKGYIQIGFSEHRLRNGIDFWFEEAALKTHIGGQGYFIIADSETGYIKSCGRRDPTTGAMTLRKGLTLADVGYDVSAEPKDRSEFFEARIFGEDCLCLSEVLCYHRIICAIPLSEVTGGGRRTLLVSMAVLFVVFALVMFFMAKLTNLVVTLQEKERVEHERQLKDLTLAKTIQGSSLPLAFPDEPDFKIYARMETAREVGGDFYDFFPVGDRVFFLVADVSGKGVPASLFMMRAKAQLRAAIAAHPHDLAAAVSEANGVLADANEAEMFVTVWIGVYDRPTGEVEYVNAGHNPPLVRRASGSVEWVRERSGLVLAAMAGAPYRVRRLTLGPGDSMLLYTDGVTEAMNGAGELYGEERLERTLGGASDRFVTDVMADVRAFAAGAEQSDDITMLAFDVKPNHSHTMEKQ